MPMLTRTDGFWDRIKAVGEQLRGSNEMEERFGWASPDSVRENPSGAAHDPNQRPKSAGRD
jgi:hypothetical protein